MLLFKFPLQSTLLEHKSEPVRLRSLCVRRLFGMIVRGCQQAESRGELEKLTKIWLPSGVGDELQQLLREKAEVLGMSSKTFYRLMRCFDISLFDVNLSYTPVCDSCLMDTLLKHGKDVISLQLAYCDKLTPELHAMISHPLSFPKLHTLDISCSSRLFAHILFHNRESDVVVPVVSITDALVSLITPLNRHMNDKMSDENAESLDSSEWVYSDRCGTSASAFYKYSLLTAAMTNLRVLIFQMDSACNESNTENVTRLMEELLGPVPCILYLDLSGWRHLGQMQFLESLRHLTTLILYDVENVKLAIDAICTLDSLTHLDVSQHNRNYGEFDRPVTTLDRIVRSLPGLVALDISGTNLAVFPSEGDWPDADDREAWNNDVFVENDITGLRQLRRPLDFLGVFGCSVAHFRRLPAKIVAGEFSEEQLFIAIEHYLYRPLMLLKVLNEAYQLYRFETATMYSKALEFMLFVMMEHPRNVNIQIAGSACLFYILRYVEARFVNHQRVIEVLLNSMETHFTEQTMVRNCCLSLCQFEFSNDLMRNYMRAITILLIVLEQFDDVMTQRIVVHLLNTMACHVNGPQKLSVGEFQAVEKIMHVICSKYDLNICDEVMEVAWSFLWNITDEAPENCARFLNEHGMNIFYNCYTKFPNRNELLRNMMGLVGNIAEVPSLRSRIMDARFVEAFYHLLENLADGIEISYNSAGVLSHLLSDGQENWSVATPSWQVVSDALITVVNSWHVRSRRFINYRSFEPMIRLLPLFHSPASQHWAVWALANLTTVDGIKYCEYVWEECGLKPLRLIESDPRTPEDTKAFAKIAIDNVVGWMKIGLC